MAFSILGPDGHAFDTPLPEKDQINFGKTKLVYPYEADTLAIVHKDILTANDNQHFTGEAPGKGTISAYTSALLFRRLETVGVKTSHEGILNANTTIEKSLDMEPLEIIWRRYHVKGNSLESRNPGKYQEGIRYPEIIYEVCLKWSVKTGGGEIIHDPFIKMDENFQPVLRPDGMPVLMHSKKPGEIDYVSVFHPNKGGDIPFDDVRDVISRLAKQSPSIHDMAEKIQEVTFDTYAQIGRLNADGKFEVGYDKDGNLILGDELEMDSLRNMNLQKIEIDGQTYEYPNDVLGSSLHYLMGGHASRVERIITARHSGKQKYRDLTGVWKEEVMTSDRQDANNAAANQVTKTIYRPVALALSNEFGKDIGYLLQRN